MVRKIHKIYDVILKIIILAYSVEFLKYIGEEREIVEILKTEISTLNGKTRFLDFLCRLEDDTLCHIEFQFPVVYSDDLERFFDYNIVAQIRYDGIVETIVFSFGNRNQGATEIMIGNSKGFHPKIFYLGDIDFEKELEKIIKKANMEESEKLNNNEQSYTKLTYEEELHLMLMSLAFKYEDKKALLAPIVELLKKEEIFHEEKIDTIRSIIQLEIDNLLSEDERKEFEGVIEMNDNTEAIIMQAISEVNRKYEQEALYEAEQRGKKEGKKEGIKIGIEKNKRDIAKKLKGLHPPEEISKITGLSLNTILLL